MFLFQKGQKIDNRYTVVFPHKEGSYAETYRVRDTSGKLRFLKLIYYSKLQYSQFDKDGSIIEIEVAKMLNHPNVCKYVDSGNLIANGQQLAYIVTEFVSGETLDKRIARENLSIYEVKQVVKALLLALQYLHLQELPIIHDEVTVQNLMLDLSGTMENLKLIDFGYAKFLNQDPSKPNLKQLNPFYMAPERLNGVSCVQSDLYSVGVILYQLIFDELPWFFDASRMSEQQVVERLQVEREHPLRMPNIDMFELDEQLLNIINKATQNDAQDRFQTAQEMMDAIDGKVKVDIIKKESEASHSKESKKNAKRGNGFADVAGMTELKEQLQSDVIDLLQNPEQARELGLKIPNGLLFYGPPGCGKTFFAEKFAEETGFNYQYVRGSDVASPYIDGGRGKIADIFSEARKNAPTILFLDEVDSLIRDRSAHNNATTAGAVNEFLTQLNNCGEDGVLVIAATNKPTDIDEAALRAGRLELKYYIPQPDKETRKRMFQIGINKRNYDFGIDYDLLAERTENYVSSDISLVIDTAARLAFRRKIGKITMALLEEAISQTKPSLTLEQIKRHEDIRDRFMGVVNINKRNKVGF
ncbi:MAG: AAA family ATPase [Paludibacteraceae bacterium]|nr:AAA family ATPase [Paludibacteraceae bacterium]